MAAESKPTSVDEKLYEALRKNVGVRLTADDVWNLVVQDNAVAVRISNAVCQAAGIDECHEDMIGAARNLPSWKQLVKELAQ